MKINERIKERRKELHLSADYIAQQLGISRASYYRYEKSEVYNMPITALEPLAKILNVTPSYLMGWDDTVTEAPSVPLTPRDERQIAADLEKMLADLDSKNSMAATALGIKPSQLMGISGPQIVKLPPEPPIELNQPERELITKYRQLDDDGKDRINRQVDFELYQLEKSAQKGEVNCG